MTGDVILCDAYCVPLCEVDVERAVQLLVSERAERLIGPSGIQHAACFKLAPSALENWGNIFPDIISDGCFMVPAVLRLKTRVQPTRNRLKPTRISIFKRDQMTCQYCGKKSRITIDHVVPTSRGGKNTWENMVAACFPCNNKKGGRTPEEAGLSLIRQPGVYTYSAPHDLFSRTMAILGYV